MKRGITQFASSFMAVSLLFAAAGCVWVFAVEPILYRFTEARDRIAAERLLLGRLEAAEQAATLVQAQKSPRSDQGERRIFLTGPSDAVRMAEVQALLGRISDSEAVSIQSTRAQPAVESAGVRLIAIEAQLRATLEQLQKILIKLERSHPYLIVQTLHVAPQLATDASAPELQLDIRIGVAGFADRKQS